MLAIRVKVAKRAGRPASPLTARCRLIYKVPGATGQLDQTYHRAPPRAHAIGGPLRVTEGRKTTLARSAGDLPLDPQQWTGTDGSDPLNVCAISGPNAATLANEVSPRLVLAAPFVQLSRVGQREAILGFTVKNRADASAFANSTITLTRCWRHIRGGYHEMCSH